MQIQFHHPWTTPVLWQAANDAVASAVHLHRDTLQDAVDIAQQVRFRVEALDPLMRDLCERTCPRCNDNCCRRATVWFDFKDMLGFHLRSATIPPGQLIAAARQTCRYLGIRGCTLPRIQRPFVCTWFICSAQKGLMDQWPSSRMQFLFNSLEALKKGRNKLEYLFLRAVT